MTEEEKKAIEKLKSYKELFSKGYCKDCNELCVIDNFPNEDLQNNIDIILNLIEKLQKERDIYYYEWKTLEADLINKDYIPKGKIREEIKELKNMRKIVKGEVFITAVNFSIKELEELLEEE